MKPQGLVGGGEPLDFQLKLCFLASQGLLAVVWACLTMVGSVLKQLVPQAALDVLDVPEQGLRPELQLLGGASALGSFGPALGDT